MANLVKVRLRLGLRHILGAQNMSPVALNLLVVLQTDNFRINLIEDVQAA